MSITAWGASWAASTTMRAPWSCATRVRSRIGHSSPVTFDAPVGDQRRPVRAARQRLLEHRYQVVRVVGHGQVGDLATPPRQQVRVVLPGERHHAAIRRHRRREQVHRIRRVAGEHHDVVVPSSDEVGDGGP